MKRAGRRISWVTWSSQFARRVETQRHGETPRVEFVAAAAEAAVLPLPVLASAIGSYRPVSGRLAAWISVIVQ